MPSRRLQTAASAVFRLAAIAVSSYALTRVVAYVVLSLWRRSWDDLGTYRTL